MAFGTKQQKNDFFRLSLTLFAITALVAAVLALANYFTAPIIERAAKERLNTSLSKLISEADSFEEMPAFPKEITAGGVSVPVDAVYEAKDSAGTFLGFCVHVAPSGYSDVIDMIVAIDQAGAVRDVEILSISDTPGIGLKVKNDQEFQKSVLGLSEVAAIVKNPPASKTQVQVIAGATISSSAYISGVNAAIDVASQLMGEVVS
ncbi:MAG: FMN-binding protein [Clostridia bacterium]|nr:FMN-binding protein [Clostridia bacterium]